MGLKLTTHLDLAPRLRRHAANPYSPNMSSWHMHILALPSSVGNGTNSIYGYFIRMAHASSFIRSTAKNFRLGCTDGQRNRLYRLWCSYFLYFRCFFFLGPKYSTQLLGLKFSKLYAFMSWNTCKSAQHRAPVGFKFNWRQQPLSPGAGQGTRGCMLQTQQPQTRRQQASIK